MLPVLDDPNRQHLTAPGKKARAFLIARLLIWKEKRNLLTSPDYTAIIVSTSTNTAQVCMAIIQGFL